MFKHASSVSLDFNSMRKVTIVILNWNGWKDTVECLKSVQKARRSTFALSILVVDNGSTNDSVKQIKKVKSRMVKVIETGRNLGFAGGNNVGITHALSDGADYVVILNNDTYVHKDCLKELVNYADENPKVGVVSPKIYFAAGHEFHKSRYKRSDMGNVIWCAGGMIDWNNIYGSNIGVDEVDNGQFEHTREIDFATGTCVLYRTNMLKEIGVFDERYFLYWEDVDLSVRAREAGWKVMYIASSKLWHKVSQSSGSGSKLNDYFTTRNRLLFGMTYASFRARFALFRESIKLLFIGRSGQKQGIRDYMAQNLGKGSWKN